LVSSPLFVDINREGLEALDFLQLQYKPPFPLDAIITSSILERYDRIFLFLLRLLRMQYISHQLFRDAASRTSYSQGINPMTQRFRIEAHHFITAISGYMFQVSIQGNWHTFQTQLHTLQKSLDSREAACTSITEIRELHLLTVEKMLYCCLLKRRQQPILTLLYGTFEPILLFAKVSRMYARREQRVWARMREEMEDNTKILYGQFMKRAGMFVRVIEQLERKGVGKAGYGGDRGEGHEGGWFADLLTRLDGSYFDR
jgi:Gamma tubulin complex component C-terminal